MTISKHGFQRFSVLFIAWMLSLTAAGPAQSEAGRILWNTRGVVSLSESFKSLPLEIAISASDSTLYSWRPQDRLHVRAYTQKPDGSRSWLRDQRGRRSWRMKLDGQGVGKLLIFPHKDSYSGPLTVLVNGKPWPSEETTPNTSVYSLEKSIGYRFPDGAGIQVHYMDDALSRYKAPADFPRQVLDAAVLGYQTLTQFEGFRTEGFSFANPNEAYAHDPDRVIDVYIGDPADNGAFAGRGFNSRYFKDAPCFDTIDRGDNRYDAVILLPANYADFIRNWEKINPSSLGRRNVEVDLRGTLVHEMSHVILFYYNRNLGKGAAGEREASSRHLDWYVEGLARYFETFVGARHDFFSQGFKQTLPDKIRFSRGGSNYFMRYPDQDFTGLRYENAIFWRYIDYRFGMAAIEKLSRLLRDGGEFPSRLKEATGVSFDHLLDDFALSILLKDFGLKDDSGYLSDVARTRLLLQDGHFQLVDGYGVPQAIGKVCRTDWVGEWGQALAAHGENTVGGDSTNDSDVSAWATDHFQIKITGKAPVLQVAQTSQPVNLSVQLVVQTRGGSMLHRQETVKGRRAAGFDMSQILREQGLTLEDIESLHLLITNHDPRQSVRYEIIAA